MANKKSSSQAERAVNNVKKQVSANPASKKSTPRKTPKPVKKAPKVRTEYDEPISSGVLTAIICFLLFVLFLMIGIKAEGALLVLVESIILGLLGQAGFFFAIPALLYLTIIHVFGRKTALRMRTVCTIVFVLLCGAIYHLIMQRVDFFDGANVLAELYAGGRSGKTGGVLCGGIAVLLRWSCGTPMSFLITILGAIITLLGAMQITIPSLIRAIANRPRPDWEEDEDDYIDPAAVVVNKIATKQIEQKRQRREQAIQARQQPELAEAAQPEPQKPVKAPKQNMAEAAPVPPAAPAPDAGAQPVPPAAKPAPSRGAAFMNRIDGEINAPLAGTANHVEEQIPNVFDEPVDIPRRNHEPEVQQEIPARMPELKRETGVSAAPRMQTQQKPEVKEAPKQTAASAKAKAVEEVTKEIGKKILEKQPQYCFPPMELLRRPVRGGADGTEEMRENSRRLNETLSSFNIDAHIINVTRGPSVTRYEVELDRGVRLNKLTGCADDIALSLGASGVRIAAVPGKISVVGIEVPNRAVTMVSLYEVIGSDAFGKAASKTSVALGKSIDGNAVVGNIAKMPHLLIAGTTGSGKSVCMNSIILSLLYKAGPEDVKLIMVDPKMVELGIYNGIPHLLIPVVTDPKKAAGSLQWAVTEMLRRYKMMSEQGVRDLEAYNSIMLSEEDGQKLPQVVIIIDELADLMMVAAKEVEDSICRIAQMGRAAGMHLIIATQRPSANVITGLMKANIPSRIAFSVASAMESRIILDTMGAEKLVGKGDMLYAPIGSGKPLRVQGCFVTDGEVEAVTEYIKENYTVEYNQQVLEEIEKKAQQTGKKGGTAAEPSPSVEELEGDEMLPAAVDVILETGQASVSMLQRRLKLGYARAARIVDEMEEKGIVGPFQGSKPRAILITKEQWEAQKNGNGLQMDFDDLENNEM